MLNMPLSISQLKRDLHWIANSPVILDITNLPEGYWLTRPLPKKIKLVVSNYDLKQVTERLTVRKSHLLGIYYEVLWHYLLAEKLGYKLRATNLQVKSDKGTLGEFDLIYQTKNSNQFFHRELAVKYYLGLPCEPKLEQTPWSYWVGPGLRDRLDLKANKLVNKQGRLSQSTAGHELLKQQHLLPVTAEILLQGYLFYPFGSYCPPPQHANINHLMGYWLTPQQLTEFIEYKQLSASFIVLAKHEWLSAFNSSTNIIQHRLLSSAALSQYATQHFTNSPYPYPLLIASGTSHNEIWQENVRFFLVSDNWLVKARSSRR
ncbi:DUF1853 family protein [Spartinivicinus ruber]|uniref:DUF1853 family protein n=1 Tax=Spartinivicinus ruber TaxID=2683272 RepID=UPI0013D4A75D|nr:DUF1853 family protein [Spartinivicinus ruber]